MTPEEIGKLTLADLEAIASRFEGAVKVFREAQALMGGIAPAAAVPPPAPRLLRPSTKGVQLTEAEIAEREALLATIRGPATSEPEFPPSIAAALGGE